MTRRSTVQPSLRQYAHSAYGVPGFQSLHILIFASRLVEAQQSWAIHLMPRCDAGEIGAQTFDGVILPITLPL
jgi:hypothetical protein